MRTPLSVRYLKFLQNEAKTEMSRNASQNDLLKKTRVTSEDVMKMYKTDARKQGETFADMASRSQFRNLIDSAVENGFVQKKRTFVQVGEKYYGA